jgi:hypothetical protein
MEWVATAEEYIGKFGWGARGRNLGISRMFGEGDKSSLSRNKLAVALRPRGLLSGFLAIIPGGTAVYIPPIAAKVQPMRLRLRVSEELCEAGAVFSAYVTRDSPRRIILEDVLVWRGESVWHTKPFSERWNTYLGEFVGQHFRSDLVLQGFEVELAQYVAPTAVTEEPDEKTVLEFVLEAPGSKRLIRIPARTVPVVTAPVAGDEGFTVRKEAGMGPDVYAVYRGETRLGLALVRTLAISRVLRLAMGPGITTVAVNAEHNKTFDKYEVLGVASPC